MFGQQYLIKKLGNSTVALILCVSILGLTGCVATTGTKPGADPGGAGAPAISAVSTKSITAASATVTWSTNVAATSLVNYGLTTSYGSQTTVNSNLVLGHSMGLTGLSASKTYHYQVVSADSAGAQASSQDFTFATSGNGTPTISEVGSSNVTTTGATISWTTNVPTTSQVKYGTTASYGQASSVNSTLATSHSVTLSGLSASTTYHYQAVSVDGPGNQVASGDFMFTTTTAVAPTISGVGSTNITSSGATITWTTNVGATSQVNYGTSATYGQQSLLSSALVTSHVMNLVGLTSSTTYDYQALSTNGAGPAASSDFTFTTSAATSGGVSFPAGQWTKLNNNTALQMTSASVDHCPANGFGGFGYNFDNNCQGVVNAWTGFGYTTAGPDGACMIEAGGGHSDYAGNELYEMCPAFDNGSGNAPGTKVRLTNPSEPASSCGDIDPLVSPTAPNEGHSYQFFVVAPNTNKLYRWAVIAGTAGGDACANFNLWALDLSTVNMACAPSCNAQWTQISGVMPTSEGLVEAHGVFNHTDGKIWTWEPYGNAGGSAGCVGVFDPVAITFSHKQCLSTNSAEYMDLAIDESQDVAMIMGNSGCQPGCAEPTFTGQIWVDLTGADGYALHKPSVDPSCATLAAAQSPGLDYDSARQTIVGWPGSGNTLYFPHVNKSSGSITCTTVNAGSTQGTDFPNPMGTDGGAGGTLGKFHYDPLNDIYVLDVVFDQPAWVYKP